jgi:hypothetical protein
MMYYLISVDHGGLLMEGTIEKILSTNDRG